MTQSDNGKVHVRLSGIKLKIYLTSMGALGFE